MAQSLGWEDGNLLLKGSYTKYEALEYYLKIINSVN